MKLTGIKIQNSIPTEYVIILFSSFRLSDLSYQYNFISHSYFSMYSFFLRLFSNYSSTKLYWGNKPKIDRKNKPKKGIKTIRLLTS